jgi:hypothetical protein
VSKIAYSIGFFPCSQGTDQLKREQTGFKDTGFYSYTGFTAEKYGIPAT